MAKKKIVFQGERGANSDLACREAYPDYEPMPCPTFEDCFSALTAGEARIEEAFRIGRPCALSRRLCGMLRYLTRRLSSREWC